jgi:hypothetical protein
MKLAVSIMAISLAAGGIFANGLWQGAAELKPGEIQPMLDGMGLDSKDLGAGTYQVLLTQDGLDIPVGVGLSKSGRKLWLTVNLGAIKPDTKADAAKLMKFLERQYDIQPTQFYVSKDILKLGAAIDNRGITPAVLRRELDKVVDDTVKTKDLWQ